jgi:TonB family protein
MAEERERRRRQGRPQKDGSLVVGGVLSALLHVAGIVLLLLAPTRLQRPHPITYTVEVVDPNALGGELLKGPIGGRAARPAAEEPKPPPPAKPVEVANAEPPPPEPERAADAVPLGTVRPTPVPRPTARATPRPAPPKPTVTRLQATATPVEMAPPKPTGTRAPVAARPKPSTTPAAVAARATAAAQPMRRADEAANATATAKATAGEAPSKAGEAAGGDLDSRLSAAIQGIESRVGRAEGRGGSADQVEGPPGVGGSGPGGGGTVRGIEFVAYYDQMLNRIKERWTWIGERQDLSVTVRFSILPSGDIANLRLMERSGDASYDASVERAVKAASPFAPPPAAYQRDFADVELTFRPADLKKPD